MRQSISGAHTRPWRWRSEGGGPKFTRVAGRIFYFLKDLDQFIAGTAAAE
jgi:hypothetical protein